MTSDLKKLDSFILETSKNHLIRNILRNGRLRVKWLVIKNCDQINCETSNLTIRCSEQKGIIGLSENDHLVDLMEHVEQLKWNLEISKIVSSLFIFTHEWEFSEICKVYCLIFLAESLVIFPKAKFTIYKFKWLKSFIATCINKYHELRNKIYSQ